MPKYDLQFKVLFVKNRWPKTPKLVSTIMAKIEAEHNVDLVCSQSSLNCKSTTKGLKIEDGKDCGSK